MQESVSREEKAIEVAVHATNHQITIASALLAGIIGFADKLKEQSALSALWAHKLWVIVPLSLAILCGIFLLLGIGFELAGDRAPFTGPIVRFLGITQTLTFGAAIIIMAILLCFVDPVVSDAAKSSPTRVPGGTAPVSPTATPSS